MLVTAPGGDKPWMNHTSCTVPQQSLTVRPWKFAFSPPKKNGSLPIIILFFQGASYELNYSEGANLNLKACNFATWASTPLRYLLKRWRSGFIQYVIRWFAGCLWSKWTRIGEYVGYYRVAIGPITHKGYCAGTLSVRYGERRVTTQAAVNRLKT